MLSDSQYMLFDVYSSPKGRSYNGVSRDIKNVAHDKESAFSSEKAFFDIAEYRWPKSDIPPGKRT